MSEGMGHKKSVMLLAAGGTGGHIFPALAVAEIVAARGHVPVLCTDARFYNYAAAVKAAEALQMPVHVLSSGTPSGHPVKVIKGMVKLARGTWQADRLLQQLLPVAVAGFGGYPSFPPLLAARWRGVPTLVHEQNARMGRANGWLAKHADAIALTFAHTRGLPEEAKGKAAVTGNPVRKAFVALRASPYKAATKTGKFHLLVVGGSLGASIFATTVPQAVAALPVAMQKRLHIVQQCREADRAEAEAAYAPLAATVELKPFVQDMPEQLEKAHVVIARAGASTVTELQAAARPAIVVPYPFAMDDHQMDNAKALEKAGGGWAIAQKDFTAAWLQATLCDVIGNPQLLSDQAQALAAIPIQHAAEALADALEILASRK